MKLNHRGQWTTEALEELERLAAQGLTAREMADRMGRTEEAIRLRARLQGVAVAKGERRLEEKARMRDEDGQAFDDAIDKMVKLSIERHGS